MQKDDRYYTFLLTHSSKTRIYIRRVQISKKVLKNTVASLIFTIGLVSFAVIGLLKAEDLYLAAIGALFQTQSGALNQQVSLAQNRTIGQESSINYQRPASLYLNKAGGPVMLSSAGTEMEESEMTEQLRVIEVTANPAYLPTMWAHLGKINNEYGFRRNPFGGRNYEFHAGMDIDGEKGDMVVAPANGVITKAGWQGGYGNLIEIDHQNGLTTRYGHLSKVEVAVGDSVQRGQLIGLVGSTGRSTGPHLHYELRLHDKAINPRRFLPPEPLEIRALNRQ